MPKARLLLGLLAAVFLAGGCFGGGGGEKTSAKKASVRKAKDPYPDRHYFHTKANANPFAGPTPLKVKFTAVPFRAYGHVRWRWRFDDGTTSRAQNPTHTFKQAGTYTVVVDSKDEKNFNDRWNLVLGAWPPEVWKARKPLVEMTKGDIRTLERDQARRTAARLRKLKAAGLPTGQPNLKPKPGLR
jgi:hypothetical protein